MIGVKEQVPTIAGTQFAGGYYAGLIVCNRDVHALIVAPKDGGEHAATRWNASDGDVPGAKSYFDGRANTIAMANAGSDLAKWSIGLTLNGFNDWYLPSRDELEVMYRVLKPTTQDNDCSFRDGENVSSIPVAYPYTEKSPTQTGAILFKEGRPEAFETTWYWSSTQYAGNSHGAWAQDFYGGYQGVCRKDVELPARAVRRLKI